MYNTQCFCLVKQLFIIWKCFNTLKESPTKSEGSSHNGGMNHSKTDIIAVECYIYSVYIF